MNVHLRYIERSGGFRSVGSGAGAIELDFLHKMLTLTHLVSMFNILNIRSWSVREYTDTFKVKNVFSLFK